jgi:hypothetical protein
MNVPPLPNSELPEIVIPPGLVAASVPSTVVEPPVWVYLAFPPTVKVLPFETVTLLNF